MTGVELAGLSEWWNARGCDWAGTGEQSVGGEDPHQHARLHVCRGREQTCPNPTSLQPSRIPTGASRVLRKHTIATRTTMRIATALIFLELFHAVRGDGEARQFVLKRTSAYPLRGPTAANRPVRSGGNLTIGGAPLRILVHKRRSVVDQPGKRILGEPCSAAMAPLDRFS